MSAADVVVARGDPLVEVAVIAGRLGLGHLLLPHDQPQSEVELIQLEQLGVPLLPGPALEVFRESFHRALDMALVEEVEDADPGPHGWIEIGVGSPPEREREAVPAIVGNRDRTDRDGARSDRQLVEAWIPVTAVPAGTR